jgi:hypothetical protein
VVNGEPELDQIGRITSIDISPIYGMDNADGEYNEELEFLLEFAESEEEIQRIKEKAASNKQEQIANLDIVLTTINNLIIKLSSIDNLADLLNDHGYDTLEYQKYFIEFEKDKGDGYLDNNFGQDLRNFSRFLEYAKTHGATKVRFNYG